MNDRDTMLLPRVAIVDVPDEPAWLAANVDDVGSAAATPPEPLAGRDPALARLAWLVPALLTLALSLIRITWPGLWGDELATWGMASTPWGRMWPVLGHVDAAIAPYYVLMHAITDVFGASDLVLRLPSTVAMAAAAAIVAMIGTRLVGPRAGLLAGLILAVLPTTSRYAQEARPYALTLCAAALATLLLLRALEVPTWRRYGGYAAALAFVGLAHVVALLVIAAHAVTVYAGQRRLPGRWLAASAAAIVPVLPVAYLAAHQSGQISWIPAASFASLVAMPGQFFGVEVLGGILLVLAVLGSSLRRPVAVFTAWALVPAVLLFAVSQVTSLWLPRYLLFTLPAWALLAATALNRTPLVRGVVLVTAIALIGAPAQIQDRTAAGHGQGTSAAAAILAANEQPGDGIVYAQSEPGGGWVARDLVAHYVPADRRPRDVFLVRPPRSEGHLLAGECSALDTCLAGAPRLWTIRSGTVSDPIAGLGFDKERLLRARYNLFQTWTFQGLTLALFIVKPDPVSLAAR